MLYVAVAYLLAPYEWSRYLQHHPALRTAPGITTTHDGHPGDPINVALVGNERELKGLLLAAGYSPADPLTLRSCLEIADATILERSYTDAPVSHLYYFGRSEDLAFELPVGDNPRRRHHVRFWKAPQQENDGRLLWIGQTSFDDRVGFSHTTGQITHHINPDVDAERNFLFSHLQKTGRLTSREAINGFHAAREGRNGGGDPWRTDGRLFVGTIQPE